MTDAAASSSPSPAPASPESAPKKVKKKWSWRKRILVTLGIIIAIGLILRIILVLALPPVLRSVAGKFGLNASYERTEIYLLGGDVGIWHFALTPKSGGEPILYSEYARADVSALNLLRGKLVVRRLEADGVDVLVDRDEKGEFPLLKQLMPPSTTPPAPAKPEKAGPTEITLDPPLRIDALRLSRARARLRDRSVTPNVDTTLELTARLSDLGSQTRPTRFLVDMTSPPLLDTLRIEGDGTAAGQAMTANLQFIVRGLHPQPAQGYLLPLGIRAQAKDISLAMNARIAAAPTTRASATQPADIAGALVIDKLDAIADGKQFAGVDRITADLVALRQGNAHFSSVVIDGAHGEAMRTRDGAIRVAGIELTTATPRSRSAATQPVAATQPSGLPGRWQLDRLVMKNLRANFRDEAVVPPADLAFAVQDITVANIINDPKAASPVASQITGKLSAPGVIRSIELSGSAIPFPPKQSVDLKIVAAGIRPDALRGYLDQAGFESQLKDGGFTCNLVANAASNPAGQLSAAADVGNIRFTDGGGDLFAFNAVKVAGLSLDPATGRTRVEAIELAGPKLAVSREADGSLMALGFRTKPPVVAPQPAAKAPALAAVESTTQPAPAAVLPSIEIAKLTWGGVDIAIDDKAVSPAKHFAVADTGLEITDLRVGIAEESEAKTGKIHGWLSIPGVAGKLAIDGTILPRIRAGALDLAVTGTQLDARTFAPYLKALNIEPTLADGSIQLRAQADVTQTNDGLLANVAVSDFKYADGGKELIRADGFKIDRAELRAGAVSVAGITLDRPHAQAKRDNDGAIEAAGLKLLPATQPAAPAAVAVVPPPATVAASAPSPAAPAAPMTATLAQLRINDATLGWQDAAIAPAVDALAHANVSLDGFVIGKEAPPAKLDVAVKLDKTIESAKITGEISAAPKAQHAKLDIVAAGIKGGALEPYLGPTMRSSLKDGRARMKIDANVAANEKGGQSASFALLDFDFRDAGAQQPLLHVDSARVQASRIDPAGRVVAIDEVSALGVDTEARLGKDGSVQLLGLRTVKPTTQQAIAAAEAKPVQAAPAAPVAEPTGGPTDVQQLLAARRGTLPLITLEKLDLNLRRFSLIDDSEPGGKPLAVRDLKLRNTQRIELLGDNPGSRPAIELELTGRVDPLVDKLAVVTKAAPFAPQATLDIDVNVTGIKGEGITTMLPELASQLDGKPLDNGRFNAKLEAQARFEKKTPTEPDFAKPFDASFLVHDVAFRNADGPILAGVEEVRADAIRVDPTKSSVVVRALEIVRPQGRVLRDAEGIHVLGLVIKTPPPTTGPATAPSTEPQTPTPSAPVQVVVVAPAPKPASEIRIDKLLISGIDFLVEDRTAAPPLLVPLTGLEVEARDVTNMLPYEDRTVRFSVVTNAGKVPLAGGRDQPLFSEVAASGQLALYPKPKGYVRSSVSGFELVSLTGYAKQAGVDLGGGLLDNSVDLRFGGDGNMDARTRTSFTDLKISEAPNGPIRSYLKLPGPLDAMILILQDQSGTITAPVNVPIKQGEVNTGAVAASAIGAFGGIVTSAVASSPLKVTGGVTSVLGLKKDEPKASSTAAEIPFPGGAAESDAAPADVKEILDRLRRDRNYEVTLRHELGQDDIVRCARRANPTPEEAAALAAKLRQRKLQLQKLRDDVSGESRAMLASAVDSSATNEATVQLRAIDRELAATEDALDRLYDLLRPGAERQADRRTRAACIELGDARLNAVRDAILAGAKMAPDGEFPNINERIRVTRPQIGEAPQVPEGQVVATIIPKKK